MTQSDLVRQAKQGNPGAIATLLNRSLQARGIIATAQLQDNCLTLELTAAQPIGQQATVAFLQQGLTRLQPAHINSVLVCAYLTEVADLEWMESFLLNQSSVAGSKAVESSSSSETELTSTLPQTATNKPVRLSSKPKPTISASTSHTPVKLQPNSISAKGIEALLIGLVLAIVLFKVGFLKMLFTGAVVIAHEIGHAVTHWAFGRPAIPTVNLLYGGGITLTFGQVWFVNALIYVAIAYFIYHICPFPRLQRVVVLLTLIYTILLLTPINHALAVAMGHGMELIAIVVCLFLAISGYLCRIPGDRAIYAMLGFFLWFHDIEFSWRLLNDPDFREFYEGGIGGVIDNDLTILAAEYFHGNLSALAQILLICCLLAPAIAAIAYIFQPWLLVGFRKLLQKP